jgi:hypothetical protein
MERISEIFLEWNRDSASETVEVPAVAVGSFIGESEGREDEFVGSKSEEN